MKRSKTKLIAFLCIAANLIMLLQAGFGVIALDDTEILRIVAEDSEFIGVQYTAAPGSGFEVVEPEMQPEMASGCSLYLTTNEALDYANNFLGANQVTDPNTGYLRSYFDGGFNQVRFDLNNPSPHINCEVMTLQPNGDYKQTYNMHVYITDI